MKNGPENPNPNARPTRPKEHFHLYLLIGQSNMKGCGRFDAEAGLPNPRVFQFRAGGGWKVGRDPLGESSPENPRVGLGTTFGRLMAQADETVEVGLIQCAVGGVPLSRWTKGADLYEGAVGQTLGAMQEGSLKGILWHQGEADSYDAMLAGSYGDRLAAMIADLRDDLEAGEIPLVAGLLGEFLDGHPGNQHGKMKHWHVVNGHICALPQKVHNTAVADSAGLSHVGDHVHFDSPSLREFGRRYAVAMSQLRAKHSIP